MTTAQHGDAWELLGRTLYDMTQLLESADGADERVRRVLELLRHLVPYERCALLEARVGQEPRVVMVPGASPDERATLTATLIGIFGQLVDANARAGVPAARPKAVPHLAVPLVGLDQVIGILFVSSPVEEYTEVHLRALSVVAASLAAYLTTLRAGAELAEIAHERDAARRSAVSANRAKDDFLALVSHELKTPLSSILAWAHVLRSTTDEAARAHAIDELTRHADAQAKLIDGILDLACIASAELRLNLRMVEPAGLIETTIEGLRRDAERKSIQLDSHLDAAAMPLRVDPLRIGQAVSILVANAIELTPAGGHVEVRLDRTAGYARIQVCDTGNGISAEALPHVFDRFRTARGDGAPAGGGLGVGLAVVKQLVELHGGRVRADSAGPKRGATFTLELPRGTGTRAAVDLVPAHEGADARLLAGVRVLLVDHDVGIRESFQSVLEEHGAEVTAVASAAEALAALERSQPDVLLFGDLALRGGSAYDAMQMVTARAFPPPVASISAWRHEDKERDVAPSIQLHLRKPVEIATLVGAVADLAGRTPGRAGKARPRE